MLLSELFEPGSVAQSGKSATPVNSPIRLSLKTLRAKLQSHSSKSWRRMGWYQRFTILAISLLSPRVKIGLVLMLASAKFAISTSDRGWGTFPPGQRRPAITQRGGCG